MNTTETRNHPRTANPQVVVRTQGKEDIRIPKTSVKVLSGSNEGGNKEKDKEVENLTKQIASFQLGTGEKEEYEENKENEDPSLQGICAIVYTR